jgi:hypothetical protein
LEILAAIDRAFSVQKKSQTMMTLRMISFSVRELYLADKVAPKLIQQEACKHLEERRSNRKSVLETRLIYALKKNKMMTSLQLWQV